MKRKAETQAQPSKAAAPKRPKNSVFPVSGDPQFNNLLHPVQATDALSCVH